MCDSDSDVEIIDIERGLELQQNTIENLEKELQIVITNCTYYQQQIQELLVEKSALKHQIKELQDLSLQKEKTQSLIIQSLEKTIEEQKEEQHKLEDQFKQELTNQLEELQRVIEKQSLQIKEYAKQIEASEEEQSILQNKLITAELHNCKFQTQIQELQGEIQQKTDTRKCVQQFNEKLMGENINNLNKIENLSMQVDGLEERILKLTQQRDHFKKQFVDVSSRIISQQQELQQLNNIKQELKNKNDNYQEQYKKLQSVLKDNIDENRKCKLVMGQLQAQIEDYRCKQDLYIRENGNLKHQLISQQQYYKEQLNQCQITLNNKDLQIQQLSDPNKLTLRKLQKQNQSILQIKQQEQDKRQIIEQQIKKQQ